MRVVIGVFFYFLPINVPAEVINNRGVMGTHRLDTGLVYRYWTWMSWKESAAFQCRCENRESSV